MLISMENGLIIHIVKMAEMLPLKGISSPLGVQSISLAEFWMSVSYSVDSHLNFATSKCL